MDELKKYLQQHADELDLDEPRPQVWHQIRSGVEVKKSANVVMLVTRWVAAACVLALAGIGGWSLLHDKPAPAESGRQLVVQQKTEAPVQMQPKDTVVAENPQPDVTAFAAIRKAPLKEKASPKIRSNEEMVRNREQRGLNDLENSFTQVINLQRARVESTPMYAETPEYFSDFKIQLKQMEKDEKQIKQDIGRRGISNDLLDQLINLYQQKLNILKQLQLEMNKTNNRFKQNRGPVDTTRTYFLNI